MIELGEISLIFALSLLLAAGFGAARLAKLVHLPSVTGYILAGIALGPSGIDLIPHELLESRLQVFTEIALMFVAFGIGERFDLQQLRYSKRAVSCVSAGESVLAFVFVVPAVGATAWATQDGGSGGTWALWVSAALVCGSIGVATAPAATISVIRELDASGPLSRLVLSNVVVNNALSIMLFGVCVAAARVLMGTATQPLLVQAMTPLVTTVAALALGLAVGIITDLIVHRLAHRADVLVVALTAVFFCGGLATFVGLSPLLAGVAAGFAVVNRDRRDVRAFRALNDFEPPIYGIFFTLAGVELHLSELVQAGAVGAAFVLARAAGKYLGAWLGARAAGLPKEQAGSIGLGLLPQAGLAIGLAFLVRHDASLEPIRNTVINVVVASVVINELVGPPLVRLMLLRAKEVPEHASGSTLQPAPSHPDGMEIVPWTWPKLTPPKHPDGYVAASISHPATVAGVTRIAALLSHHYRAVPLAVHVVTEDVESFWETGPDQETVALFRLARREAASLGYDLSTEVEFADEVAAGILRTAESQNSHAIVLGHPLAAQAPAFGRIVDAVARDALCPVVVVKFSGALHTERILVPLSWQDDFRTVEPMVCALGAVSEHQITLLRLMPPETQEPELRAYETEMLDWAARLNVPGTVTSLAITADSRVHAILEAAEQHDIVVMATNSRTGLRRAFFGSLAEDVAQQLHKPILLVRGGLESRTLDEIDVSPC